LEFAGWGIVCEECGGLALDGEVLVEFEMLWNSSFLTALFSFLFSTYK
jgi:hypothetical protein